MDTKFAHTHKHTTTQGTHRNRNERQKQTAEVQRTQDSYRRHPAERQHSTQAHPGRHTHACRHTHARKHTHTRRHTHTCAHARTRDLVDFAHDNRGKLGMLKQPRRHSAVPASQDQRPQFLACVCEFVCVCVCVVWCVSELRHATALEFLQATAVHAQCTNPKPDEPALLTHTQARRQPVATPWGPRSMLTGTCAMISW